MNARLIVLLVSLMTIKTGHAIDQPSGSGLFYYQIGGGTPLAYSANNGTTVIPLGGNVNWDTNFACGSAFDPQLSVSNQLNGVTEGFQNMMGNVISSAKGAVASLPAMLIQRINPGLYDLLTQGVLQGKFDLNFANTSCEEMQKTIMGGDGVDFEKMVTISKSGDMRKEMASGDGDAIAAQKKVDETRGNNGVDWFGGGKRGGQGSAPMEYVKDTSISGYNILMNRSVTNSTQIGQAGKGKPLAETWGSPIDAANWAVDVLGDKTVRTCEGCQKTQGTPGKGLVAKYEENQKALAPKLAALVNAPRPPAGRSPTSAQLAEVSATGIVLNQHVIDALREEPDRDLLIQRLSGEIALAKTMEQALLLRRMIEAGKNESNVANIGPYQEAMEKQLETLNKEMNNLLFELDVRERIATGTPQKLLARYMSRKAGAEPGKTPGLDLINGGVKPK